MILKTIISIVLLLAGILLCTHAYYTGKKFSKYIGMTLLIAFLILFLPNFARGVYEGFTDGYNSLNMTFINSFM